MSDKEELQIRIHGDASKPTLVYLPGVHGDWCLVSSFRERMKPHVRFVEFIYPRTLSWSLDDYAEAVLAKLAEHDIREGILLGESYGSQVAWPIIQMCMEGGDSGGPGTQQGDETIARPFTPLGLILSGGFGRYPFMPLVGFTKSVWAIMPNRFIRFNFWAYAMFARWRHRNAPETAAAISEFIDRRTPLDLRAIDHRFQLIRQNQPEVVAQRVEIPVYQLTGFWDPIVHYPAVRSWLKKHCPGYRSTHVIPRGDHNVLGTAPDQAAEVVTAWIHAVQSDQPSLSGGRVNAEPGVPQV